MASIPQDIRFAAPDKAQTTNPEQFYAVSKPTRLLYADGAPAGDVPVGEDEWHLIDRVNGGMWEHEGSEWVFKYQIGSGGGGGGTIDSVVNLGAGSQVSAGVVGTTATFRSITSAGGSVSVTQTSDEIDLAVVAIDSVTNLGAGAEVAAGIVGESLELRTITSNDGSVSISESGVEIDLSVVGGISGGLNLGLGAALYAGVSGQDLAFRSLKSSNGSVAFVQTGSEIDLSAAASVVKDSLGVNSVVAVSQLLQDAVYAPLNVSPWSLTTQQGAWNLSYNTGLTDRAIQRTTPSDGRANNTFLVTLTITASSPVPRPNSQLLAQFGLFDGLSGLAPIAGSPIRIAFPATTADGYASTASTTFTWQATPIITPFFWVGARYDAASVPFSVLINRIGLTFLQIA